MEFCNLVDTDHDILGEWQGDPFTLRPPRVLNEKLIPANIRRAMSTGWDTGTFDFVPVRLCRLRDVYVVAEGLVVTRDLRIVMETVAQHSATQMKAALERVSAASETAKCEHLRGCSALLRKRGDANYGHWLVECLPKLSVALQCLRPERLLVPRLGNAMSHVVRDSLVLACDGDMPATCAIDNESVLHCDELLIVDGLTQHGTYMSPMALVPHERLREKSRGFGCKRVYIERNGVRSLSNADTLAPLMEALGFTRIDPARMLLSEQIGMLKDAEFVVGAMGAGMTNIVFAHRGAAVVNLAPSVMPDTFFYFLAAHRAQSYTEIRCAIDRPEEGRNSDFTVDVELLQEVLRGCM